MTRTPILVIPVAVGALAAVVFVASGQTTQPTQPDPATHAQHAQQSGAKHITPPAGTPATTDAQPMVGIGADANTDLVNQIAQLRAQVAQLQAALMQNHLAQPMQPAPSGMGMNNRLSSMRPAPRSAAAC